VESPGVANKAAIQIPAGIELGGGTDEDDEKPSGPIRLNR
jgi:hypothetical protein